MLRVTFVRLHDWTPLCRNPPLGGRRSSVRSKMLPSPFAPRPRAGQWASGGLPWPPWQWCPASTRDVRVDHSDLYLNVEINIRDRSCKLSLSPEVGHLEVEMRHRQSYPQAAVGLTSSCFVGGLGGIARPAGTMLRAGPRQGAFPPPGGQCSRIRAARSFGARGSKSQIGCFTLASVPSKSSKLPGAGPSFAKRCFSKTGRAAADGGPEDATKYLREARLPA